MLRWREDIGDRQNGVPLRDVAIPRVTGFLPYSKLSKPAIPYIPMWRHSVLWLET